MAQDEKSLIKKREIYVLSIVVRVVRRSSRPGCNKRRRLDNYFFAHERRNDDRGEESSGKP